MIHLLQIYRGWAVLLVVLHHASGLVEKNFSGNIFLSIFTVGGAGVQFFFVLSGFIIWHIHKGDIGKRENFVSYLRKRAIRIYPIYILVTLLLVPFWFLIPSIGADYHKDLISLILSLALIPQDHAPHLGVAWSLTHEIFFYMIFSVLILNATVGKYLLFFWVLAFFVFNLLFADQMMYPMTFIFSPNNLLFAFGILAAVLANKYTIGNTTSLTLLFLGNILFVTTGLFLFISKSAHDYNPGNYSIFIILFGMASFLIVLQARNIILDVKMKNWRFANLLGNASYSVYLLHYPVLSALCKGLAYFDINEFIPSTVIFLMISIFAVLMGVLLYLWVEKPLLVYFQRWRAA